LEAALIVEPGKWCDGSPEFDASRYT